MIVGPIELFFPFQAAAQFGPHVWLMLLALYALCVVLVLLLLRPRLVIYNISIDRLRAILAESVDRLDPDARWAGDSLVLPGLGVQLYVDNFAAFRSISLVSAGGQQSHQGWRRLEAALAPAIAREEIGRNPGGLALIGTGLLMIGAIGVSIAQNPKAVAQSLLDIAQAVLRMAGF